MEMYLGVRVRSSSHSKKETCVHPCFITAYLSGFDQLKYSSAFTESIYCCLHAYVFRADHLTLDNPLGTHSWERLILYLSAVINYLYLLI